MSTSPVSRLDDSADLCMTTEDDVEFDRIQSISHGGYSKSVGSVELEEEYRVIVTERDDNYLVQVRGENGIVDQNYVDSDSPKDLPESSEELYEVIREDILEEGV